MKKIVFILIAACLLVTSCSKSGNAFKEPESSSEVKKEESSAESSKEESSVEESSVEESSEVIESESSVEESSVEESSVEESSTEEPAESKTPAEFPGDTADQQYYELQFKVPADWTKEEDGSSTFFYGGNNMLQLSSANSTVPNLLSDETKNSWIEGFGSAFENYKTKSIVDTTVAGVDAFRFEFSAAASTQPICGEGLIFQSRTKLYVFVIYNTTSADARDAYIDIFEAVIDSIAIGEAAETNTSWKTKYEAGEYVGGDTIPAGEYVFFKDSDFGGVLMISTNGDFDDYENIIFSEIITSTAITSINEGEYAKLSYCYAVPIEEVGLLPLDVESGWFLVGKNLPAGTYKLEPTQDDTGVYYYFIYRDNRKDDLVTYGDVTDGATITVEDGQYLNLANCHIVE